MKNIIPAILLVLCCTGVFFISCSKEKTGMTLPNTVDTTITDTTIFLDITLDGVRTLGLQNPENTDGDYAWGTEWGTGLADGNLYSLNFPSVAFIKNRPPGLLFNFAKGGIYLHGTDQSVFPRPTASFHTVDSFFAPGNYMYAGKSADTTYPVPGNPGITLTRTLLTDGIYLSWIDSTGTVWQTCGGSADQTGSSFSIITNATGGNPLTDFASGTIVTAIFNCKLYDESGHVKQLTNGRFRLGFWL